MVCVFSDDAPVSVEKGASDQFLNGLAEKFCGRNVALEYHTI